MERKLRIVVAKPGLDGHDRGALILCRAFQEAGMEVIYTGVNQTTEQIVRTAMAEDADAVAISLLDGPLILIERVSARLKELGASDVCVFAGGVIPDEDKPRLEAKGVTGNFGPGTPLPTIIEHVVERVRQERWKTA